MVDWKKGIKKIGVATGKGVVKGAKIVAGETKKKAKNTYWKKQIIDKMYPGTIKKLAYDKGLKPQSLDGGRPTIDDYRRVIMLRVSLDELIEFARRKNTNTRHYRENR